MNNRNTLHKYASLLLAVILLLSVAVIPVAAEENVDLYVFQRDGNGQPLFLYQSPCMLGYDLNNANGSPGVPIQAFLYTMYNTKTEEHFPTYCTDINITAVQGAYYRRMNLEYSPFAGSAAGKIRAILQNGFYIIPVDGESDSDHAARVAARTAALGKAAGVADLTTGEAIAATQAAIWRAAHGSALTFPKFCRSVFKPTNTKYRSLCSYDILKTMDNALISNRIEKVYNYLLSLAPVQATSQVVSASSFVKMENLVITDNGDGTCSVSVDVTVDVDMEPVDNLVLYTTLGEIPSEKVSLTNGQQTHTLTIPDVPAEDSSSGDIKLFVSGTQTVSGFFYFDAEGGREASQAMVAYDSSQQPVFLELTAAPKEGTGGSPDIPDVPVVSTGDIQLLKVDADQQTPLAGATFEVYRSATAEELNADGNNLVTIPGLTTKMVKVSFYSNADLTGDPITSVTTGNDGKAAIYGLPYDTYYLVETEAPAGYNLMAECKKLTLDTTSYTITIENKAGTFLPSTGGIGTSAYTAGGMVLICIACLFLYRNKRKMTKM